MINPPKSITKILPFLSQAYSKYYPPMYSKPSTTQEIENIIHELKARDACGYDEMCTQILNFRASLH
jgi:hypothetical protein